MANIRKIKGKSGTSYKITVSLGRDETGKQIRHYKTWTPDRPMTAKQMEKEAKQAAADFEKELEHGFIADDRQTFEQYARYVLRAKEIKGMEIGTLRSYERTLETNVFPFIGSMMIRKIRPQHITSLYEELSKPGAKKAALFARPEPKLFELLQKTKIPQKEIAKQCGVYDEIFTKLKRPGVRVKVYTAEKIAKTLNAPIDKVFTVEGKEEKLSTHTIRTIHQRISAIFAYAEKEMIITYNPASRAVLPAAEKTIPNYFQPEQISQILDALEDEPVKWRAMIHLFIVTGARRGEILGLKWDKVDFKKKQLCIDCSLKIDEKTQEIYEGATKTGNTRYVTIPEETVALLKKYKIWQMAERLKYGDLWQGAPYVFLNQTGGAIRPTGVNSWLCEFSKRHGLRHINPHAFRHSAASIMIANGVDIVTVSKMLGHSKPTTTMDIYSHAVEESKRKATECIADVILRKKSG